MNVVGKYFLNILRALDELGNALAFGSPHETISSRLGRNWRGSALERAVDGVAGEGHCESAAENEMNHSAAGLDEILAMKEDSNKTA
jgi:hypothetical protein